MNLLTTTTPRPSTIGTMTNSLRRPFSTTRSTGQSKTGRPFAFAFPWRQYRPFRRFATSSKPDGPEPSSLSQRLKKLSREYGWSALGVYLLLSALDFPFCFAAVRLLGVERIGHYEHMLVESAKEAVEAVWSRKQDEQSESQNTDVKDRDVTAQENKKANSEEASLWTQVVLAYAIHKSLIFIRVPITAAITPKVVKILRQWGWDLVRGKPKGL
ncbi:hypothetical protein AWENTII_003951 [Aspergillus wentii]